MSDKLKIQKFKKSSMKNFAKNLKFVTPVISFVKDIKKTIKVVFLHSKCKTVQLLVL